MISLTKLNAFKEKLTAIANAENGDMVQNHKIITIKSHILECYENVIEVSEANLAAFESALISSMKKAINGVLGKKDEIPTDNSKKTKR